jgi:hypothetical protein
MFWCRGSRVLVQTTPPQHTLHGDLNLGALNDL